MGLVRIDRSDFVRRKSNERKPTGKTTMAKPKWNRLYRNKRLIASDVSIVTLNQFVRRDDREQRKLGREPATYTFKRERWVARSAKVVNKMIRWKKSSHKRG